MPSLGPAEILVVLVIALLVFGPNKMPEIARQVGRGVREFRRVQQHLRSELRDVVSEFDSPFGTEPATPAGAPTGPSGSGDPVPTLPPVGDDTPRDNAAPDDATTADDHPAPPTQGD